MRRPLQNNSYTNDRVEESTENRLMTFRKSKLNVRFAIVKIAVMMIIRTSPSVSLKLGSVKEAKIIQIGIIGAIIRPSHHRIMKGISTDCLVLKFSDKTYKTPKINRVMIITTLNKTNTNKQMRKNIFTRFCFLVGQWATRGSAKRSAGKPP